MLVISGCPRSGTSLMMDLLRVTFGDGRILGRKFPQEERTKQFEQKHDNESEEQYQLRLYMRERDDPDWKKDMEKARDMNPNGFWEMLYTVQGCHYRLYDADRLEKLLNEPEDKLSICKIVSQGLAQTDPRYIHKIIYMIRHPRAVAKSQERLRRKLPAFKGTDGQIYKMEDEVTIHTPEMYINVTEAASRWFIKNPDIPVYFIFFDELVEKPSETLTGLQEWLGEGDFTEAIKQINPKLKRSHPQEVEHELWEIADTVYDLFIRKDFSGVAAYLDKNRKELIKQNAQWRCYRAEIIANHKICGVCRRDSNARNNMIRSAERMNVNWRNQPCVFECGVGELKKHLTIEESIRNNFWKDTDITNKEPAQTKIREPILI